MFETFGEMNSAQELNELAVNLLTEGDQESVRILAKENGIDMDIAELFMNGEIPYLTDEMSAAIGKVEVEAKELGPVESMEDWIEHIKARCFESGEIARAVRHSGKSLKGCFGAMIRWSIHNTVLIDQEIIKAAGINSSRVEFGMIGMRTAKELINEYYLGGAGR